MKTYKFNSPTLMGFKGQTYMDSGYFYAPYIPLTSTPTVMSPGSLPEDIPVPVIIPKKKMYRSIDDPWEVVDGDDR